MTGVWHSTLSAHNSRWVHEICTEKTNTFFNSSTDVSAGEGDYHFEIEKSESVNNSETHTQVEARTAGERAKIAYEISDMLHFEMKFEQQQTSRKKKISPDSVWHSILIWALNHGNVISQPAGVIETIINSVHSKTLEKHFSSSHRSAAVSHRRERDSETSK